MGHLYIACHFFTHLAYVFFLKLSLEHLGVIIQMVRIVAMLAYPLASSPNLSVSQALSE